MLRRSSLFIHVERFSFIFKTDHMAYELSSKYVVGTSSMQASSKGVSNGSNSGNFFQLMRGERESKFLFQWAIIGPPAKRHLNGVMSFRWRVDHGCWHSLLSSFIYVIVSAFIWR